MKKKKKDNKKLYFVVTFIILIILLIIGIVVNVNNKKDEAKIDYSSNVETPQIDMEVLNESAQGNFEKELEQENIPTVESVDSDTPQTIENEEECETDEECGQGSYYPEVTTTSAGAFLNATLGRCYDVDGHYGEQCWDYASLFFMNYAGHPFYTCGTGSAKGAIQEGCWEKNAGNQFTMIWNPQELQAGDWVVFNNGTYGHVGMATGNYNNGYITLAGQNQGGGLCAGSSMGAKVNIINISLKYFAGAFRPNSYIKTDPKSSESVDNKTEETKDNEDSKAITYTYKKGDYFSKVLIDLGLDEGNLWGENGTVKKYTEELIEQNMLENGTTGNVKIGVEFKLW